MASLFSKIISGQIPCYRIAENEDFIAFLDIFPMREGHTLVVPKTETDKIFDVGDELLSRWLVFARPIARAIERNFPCNRCGIAVIGLEVSHAHMHLVPIDSADDLNFTRAKLKVSQERFLEIQQLLVSTLV